MTDDLWVCGRPIGKYQGTFPRGFLDRVNREFGIYNKTVLFPFGGITEQRDGWTINDIDESLNVDTNHDARNLPDDWTDRFDVVLSDPPYSEHYSEEYYDCEYPRPKTHFVEASRCVRPGGYLLILDWLVYKNYCPDELNRETVIGVTCGPKLRIRALNVFRKKQSLDDFLD